MAAWVARHGRRFERAANAEASGIIDIGWEGLDRDLGLFGSRAELREHISRLAPDAEEAAFRTWAGHLSSFEGRMRVGEPVAMPCEDGTFAVGRVTGDYRFRDPKAGGAVHSRRVSWCSERKSRTDFDADILASLLGSPQTLYRILPRDPSAEERLRALVARCLSR